MNARYAFVSVDLQNDFASVGGRLYSPKPSLTFLRATLFPYVEGTGHLICEIVSDYRLPRPGYTRGCCEPGDWGYESIVPAALAGPRLIKAMNSPVWTRRDVGDPQGNPGLPYPDPARLGAWLEDTLGAPGQVVPVVFGLTIDCCVLCVAQELFWHGYEPVVLREGVDAPSGRPEDRDVILATTVQNWAKVLEWRDLLRFDPSET
jgi:nicotinamidase-related amidase